MSEYEDEDSRTIFCANLSDKVTDALLFELFLQGGPLQKVHIPTDKETGRPRSFGFITYVHAISVSYAISLFQGTRLFNRELTIKPRNNNNSITQYRPEFPIGQQPQTVRNPFDSFPISNNETNRNHSLLQQPVFSTRDYESSSLRSGYNQINTKASMIPQPSNRQQESIFGGRTNEPPSLLTDFNQIQTKASMIPQPSKRSNPHPQSNVNASIDALLALGSKMLQSQHSSRSSFDPRFDERHSSNFKMTQRQHNRSHHKDAPYARSSRDVSPRRDVSSRRQRGSDRRRR